MKYSTLLLPKAIGAVIGVCAVAFNAFSIDFDLSFGSAGKFMTTFADVGQPSSAGRSIYIQPASGRTVIVGPHQQQGVTGRTSGFVLAGLTPLGTLDSGFGTGGKIVNWSSASSRNLIDSVMLADGSIVVFYQFVQAPSIYSPGLLKYTPDGQADTSFNANVQLVENQTIPVIMAAGANGRLYVIVRQAAQYSLVRLNSDGSRDSTFGPDGVRALNLNRFPQPTIFGFSELEGGKLLLTGHHYETQGYAVAFAARFNSDATLDRFFGSQGVTRISIPWGSVEAQTTVIQPDGKILIGGYWTFLGSNAVLIRLTPRGRLDAGFGNGGVAMTSFNNWNGVRGIALAPDGKIFVAGHCGEKAIPPNERLFVARFSATGVRESFLVTNFITNRDAAALDLALTPNGKMVIAGFTKNPGDNFTQLAAARFEP